MFPSALPASPLQDNKQCGVYNSAHEGHWQSLSCESALPYICKKTPNNTRRAEPLGKTESYEHTRITPTGSLFSCVSWSVSMGRDYESVQKTYTKLFSTCSLDSCSAPGEWTFDLPLSTALSAARPKQCLLWICVYKCVNHVCLVLTFPSCLLILPRLTENWQYINTECADGWWPHNGFCYRLLTKTEAGSWEESAKACGSLEANLTSIHSLSEVEMLLNLLANCKEHRICYRCDIIFTSDILKVVHTASYLCFTDSGESSEVWIGLWKQASSPTVEWSDGSPVTLTQWHQYNPPHNLTDTALCTKVDKKVGPLCSCTFN